MESSSTDLDASRAVSIPAALTEMVAYNGGKTLTCLALFVRHSSICRPGPPKP